MASVVPLSQQLDGSVLQQEEGGDLQESDEDHQEETEGRGRVGELALVSGLVQHSEEIAAASWVRAGVRSIPVALMIFEY